MTFTLAYIIYVQVDHAVVASQFRDSKGKETVAASHRQLKGYLVDRAGDVVRELSTADGGSNRVRADRHDHVHLIP